MPTELASTANKVSFPTPEIEPGPRARPTHAADRWESTGSVGLEGQVSQTGLVPTLAHRGCHCCILK